MPFVRRRASLVALVWLLSHASTIALALTALCCREATAASADAEPECTMGAMCPMHKPGAAHSAATSAHHSTTAHHSTAAHHSMKTPAHRSTVPATPDRKCVLRSGCDSETMGIGAVTLDLALLPDASVASDSDSFVSVPPRVDTLIARDLTQDLPPPRS